METCIEIFLEDAAHLNDWSFRLLSFVSAILEERVHNLGCDFSVLFLLNENHLFLYPINIVILLLEEANPLRDI